MSIGADIITSGKLSLMTITKLCGASLGIAVLALTIFVCYYFADWIFTKLGKLGTQVVTQLAAFILLAISVEIVWEGIKTLIVMS
jgi:multiple antibiotic resistance protein